MKHLLPSAAALLLLVGCASTAKSPTPPPPARTGDPVADREALMARAPAKDRVLWQYRTGLTALRQGRFDEAKRLLDDAILSIGGILGKDASARKSRSLFRGENSKNFIGEPYERVMAYYYRGLLYWRDGEPDNARACYRSAQLIDSDSEHKEYAADYSLLEYLDGFASAKLSADGSESYARAQKFSRLEQPPAYNTKANVMVFVEFGNGPTKYSSGQYGEQLRFRAGSSKAATAVVKVDGQAVRVRPYDDLTFQATTRGGRVMDHVLANKAVFKSTTDTAGDAALVTGAILAGTQGGRGSAADEVGLGLLAAGLLSKIAASAANPAADVRCWDNLPQYLSFAALELPPGEHLVTVEFQTAGGSQIVNLTRTWKIQVPTTGQDVVVFASDRKE